MKTNLVKFLAATAALAASSAVFAGPQAITADFKFGWGGDHSYTGHIAATDVNNDGLITVGEVTSIQESLSGHNAVSQLFDIGTINIGTQHWLANGVAWNGTANVAFLTFDNRSWSCNTSNGCDAVFTSFATAGGNVPEPAVLSLVALALVGAGVASRKRKSA